MSDSVGLIANSPLALALTLIALVVLYWVISIRLADPSRPPRAPYWIPWVGSALEIGKNPDEFFKNTTKLLGPIFRVQTFGQEMIYVTEPSLIDSVYRDTEVYDSVAIRKDFWSNFTIRRSIMDQHYMEMYMPSFHHALLPSNLKPMISLYLQSAHEALYSMITNMDGASGPLTTFIVPSAYRAAAIAGFGPKFPVEESFPLFKAFDNDFHLIAARLPHFLASKPHHAWDKLLVVLEAYVSEMIECGDEVTPFAMDALAGYRRGDWTRRDVAAMLGCQLWHLQSNAIYAAYWLFALLLQQPEGISPLVSELDEARRQWQATNPSTPTGPAFFEEVTTSSKTLPLLSSAIHEVLRYATSVASMRHITTPVKLGGRQLLAGDRIVCVTRQVHIDGEIQAHADELDIRRYLEPSSAKKDGELVVDHSQPWGGGVTMCRGRHFAMTELRAFIAILMTYASIEIDEECITRPAFTWERTGLGVYHPQGDMDVIVRKRKL